MFATAASMAPIGTRPPSTNAVNSAAYTPPAMSMSTPASTASIAESVSPAVRPCTASWRIESQSLTTKPSKPHSARSTSRSRNRLAVAGTPLRSLKEVMTLTAPAASAARNGGRYTLRSSFSGMLVVA
jgi:hypothetical protein